jgi:hypothetical protein
MKIDRREMIKSAAVAGAGMALGNLTGLAAEVTPAMRSAWPH